MTEWLPVSQCAPKRATASLLTEPRKGDELRIGDRVWRITQVCGVGCAYAGPVNASGQVEYDRRIDDLAWAVHYAAQEGAS
jgi:hypothetical protein